MIRQFAHGKWLVGFYLINEKPTSSKDPFALRRAAIGLLRTIIENNLTVKIRDLIDYFITIYLKQARLLLINFNIGKILHLYLTLQC